MSLSQTKISGFLKRRRRSSSLSESGDSYIQCDKKYRQSRSLSPAASRVCELEVNMATKPDSNEDIREMLKDIKESQARLLQSVDSKFQNMQLNMEKEFKELRTHVDLEVPTINAKIELLEKRVVELEERTTENRTNSFDPEVTVVCINKSMKTYKKRQGT